MGNYERNPLMADFSVDYFETKDGVRLRYLHKGEGMPFILLHGYSDDADMWMLNAPAYADQYAVYCIDQRGHVNSPALHGARISRLGADLHEFIESLGAPKVNLMGHSMGCSVIWSYIDIFGQDKINKVIFDDEPPMLVSNPNFTQEDIMRTGSNPMDPWALANAVVEGGLAWQPGSPFFEVFPSCFKRGILVFKDEEYAAMPDDYLEKMAQRPVMPDTTPEQNAFLGALLKDHLMLDWRDLVPTIISELRAVTVKAVRTQHADVRSKGKIRTVFLPGKLCRKLRQYIRQRGLASGPIFVTKSGRPVDRSNVWTEMKRLCAQAGVSPCKVFPHNLRHLFARRHYNQHRDIAKLADILGHSSINTTRLYTISSGREHALQIEELGLVI